MTIESIDTRKRDEFIVHELKELLEKAEKGEIIGFACAFIRNDLKLGNCFQAVYPSQLLGELLIVQREIMDNAIDTRLHKAGKEY